MEHSKEPAPIVTFDSTIIGAEEINELIRDVWQELQASPESRQVVARYAGVPAELLASGSPPFMARQEASRSGVVGGIAVFLALEASRALIAHGVDKLWDQVFWPRLKALFGAKLKPR